MEPVRETPSSASLVFRESTLKKAKTPDKKRGQVSYGVQTDATQPLSAALSRTLKDLLARGSVLYSEARYGELEVMGLEWAERYPAHSAKAWDLVGLARFHTNQFVKAEEAIRKGIEVDPEHIDLWDRLGVVLNRQGRFNEAHAANVKAIALAPRQVHLLTNTANNLGDAKRHDEALSMAERAIKTGGPAKLAVFAYANGLIGVGRLDEGIESYRKLISAEPDWAEAWHNLGGAYNARGRLDDAVHAFRQALRIQPNLAESWNNLGLIFRSRKQDQEALDCFNRAIDLRPDLVDPYINVASLLHGNGRQLTALTYLEHARKLKPTEPVTYMALGGCFQDLSRFDDAVVAFCTALELKPGFNVAFNNLLFALNYHPTLPAEEIFKVYQQFEEINTLIPLGTWNAHSNDRNSARRLRVGYVSPDFSVHPVQNFLEPLLAHHDREQVELFAYADVAASDWMTDRYRTYMDHWCSSTAMSDHELAHRIRTDGIDILVDLAGHTGNNRLQSFSLKPAPVQISWLGYGSTTGMTAIDYFLADGVMMPPGCEALLAETPWRLPHAGFVYRPSEFFPQPTPSPALRNGYVTFGSLSRAVRLNDELIVVWAELLKRVPTSRLVINSRDFKNGEMQDWMLKRFKVLDVDPSRIDVDYESPAWLPMANIDIMLDCFPHNSGTTLIEGLYSGLPVVTLAHRPTVGRLGASLLHSIGHPEWVATDVEEYVRIATDLAAGVQRLAYLRDNLRNDVRQSAAMDELGFARDVEQAYRQMWQKYCAS